MTSRWHRRLREHLAERLGPHNPHELRPGHRSPLTHPISPNLAQSRPISGLTLLTSSAPQVTGTAVTDQNAFGGGLLLSYGAVAALSATTIRSCTASVAKGSGYPSYDGQAVGGGLGMFGSSTASLGGATTITDCAAVGSAGAVARGGGVGTMSNGRLTLGGGGSGAAVTVSGCSATSETRAFGGFLFADQSVVSWSGGAAVSACHATSAEQAFGGFASLSSSSASMSGFALVQDSFAVSSCYAHSSYAPGHTAQCAPFSGRTQCQGTAQGGTLFVGRTRTSCFCPSPYMLRESTS